MDEYKKYSYTGPVSINDKLVAEKWHGVTYAKTKKRAVVNLKYQFTQKLGVSARSAVQFPKDIKEEGDLELGPLFIFKKDEEEGM